LCYSDPLHGRSEEYTGRDRLFLESKSKPGVWWNGDASSYEPQRLRFVVSGGFFSMEYHQAMVFLTKVINADLSSPS
jgi:hypothetical protein